MARRGSKGKKLNLLTIIGLMAIIIFAVAVTVLTQKKKPYSGLPSLPMSDISDNGNSLRGNKYMVEGKIEERWVKSDFEGLHLLVSEAGQQYPLFIKIPKGLKRPNLEREKHYAFSIEITEGGIPLATGIQRL